MAELINAIMSSQVTVAAASFFFGIMSGFFVGYVYAKKTSTQEKRIMRTIVSSIVIILWAASVISDLYRGETNTSPFLYIFMGAVIGTLNQEFGEWILKLWNRE